MRAVNAGIALLLTASSIGVFADGFEAGDLTAWSASGVKYVNEGRAVGHAANQFFGADERGPWCALLIGGATEPVVLFREHLYQPCALMELGSFVDVQYSTHWAYETAAAVPLNRLEGRELVIVTP